MKELTFEETNLLCVYNGTSDGTRSGLIAALTEMKGYLEADENELCSLTDSALSKLERMSDEEFAALDLVPDFDMEDAAYGG